MLFVLVSITTKNAYSATNAYGTSSSSSSDMPEEKHAHEDKKQIVDDASTTLDLTGYTIIDDSEENKDLHDPATKIISLSKILTYPEIKKLILTGSNATDNIVKAIVTRYRNLQEINLIRCTKITDAAVIEIALNCKKFKTIALDGSSVSEGVQKSIKNKLRIQAQRGLNNKSTPHNFQQELDQCSQEAQATIDSLKQIAQPSTDFESKEQKTQALDAIFLFDDLNFKHIFEKIDHEDPRTKKIIEGIQRGKEHMQKDTQTELSLIKAYDFKENELQDYFSSHQLQEILSIDELKEALLSIKICVSSLATYITEQMKQNPSKIFQIINETTDNHLLTYLILLMLLIIKEIPDLSILITTKETEVKKILTCFQETQNALARAQSAFAEGKTYQEVNHSALESIDPSVKNKLEEEIKQLRINQQREELREYNSTYLKKENTSGDPKPKAQKEIKILSANQDKMLCEKFIATLQNITEKYKAKTQEAEKELNRFKAEQEKIIFKKTVEAKILNLTTYAVHLASTNRTEALKIADATKQALLESSHPNKEEIAQEAYDFIKNAVERVQEEIAFTLQTMLLFYTAELKTLTLTAAALCSDDENAFDQVLELAELKPLTTLQAAAFCSYDRNALDKVMELVDNTDGTITDMSEFERLSQNKYSSLNDMLAEAQKIMGEAKPVAEMICTLPTSMPIAAIMHEIEQWITTIKKLTEEQRKKDEQQKNMHALVPITPAVAELQQMVEYIKTEPSSRQKRKTPETQKPRSNRNNIRNKEGEPNQKRIKTSASQTSPSSSSNSSSSSSKRRKLKE